MIMNENIDRKMQRGEFLIHTLFFAHHCFASFYINVYVDLTKSKHISVMDMDNYRYRYLTTWNFALQKFYLGMMIVAHIMRLFPQNKRLIRAQKIISKVRGFLYASLVFPIGLFVSGIFWIVWNINRELVFPKVADEVLPSWMNHSIHTIILLVLLVELFFYKKMPSYKDAAKGALVFFLGYTTTFFFTYYQSSRWLYGLFGVFSWPERLFFMFSNYFISLILIRVCLAIQTIIHEKKLTNSSHSRLISKKCL